MSGSGVTGGGVSDPDRGTAGGGGAGGTSGAGAIGAHGRVVIAY